MTEKQVYVAIAAVISEMSKEGISKSRKNQQQGYSFRGIDEVLNALSPMLAKNNLCIIPRVVERTLTERTTQKGGVLFYVTVKAEFDFVSAIDGTIHTAVTYGEAMDSADKATNKAMSAAYKYAAFQTFCIPTEGDNDADATTHEVAPKKAQPKEPVPMPDSEYNYYRGAVGGAESLDELKQVYTEGFTKAREYGDKPAQEGLTKIKDIRKEELEKLRG